MQTRLLTCAEMAAADKSAQEDYGIPALVLMENASRGAARFILREVSPSGKIVIAAGKGNNGGDALAIARHLFLAGITNLHILLLRRELGELPRIHFRVLERLGLPVSVFVEDPAGAERLAAEASWIIDGLYGVGIKGPLRDDAARLVEMINESPARVISLDVPSGLSDGFCASWPVVRADYTLTFEAPKLCLYLPLGRKTAGRIETLGAGFPPECLKRPSPAGLLRKDEALKELLPRIQSSDYKNSRGHIAVFAGAPGTTGAALLCGEAALRAGAGLVSLFVAPDVYPVLASACRSLMVKPLEAEDSQTGSWDSSAYKAILAGPGWGRGPRNAAWLRRFIASGLPGVLDADALHVLKDMPGRENLNLRGWVLTPHPGEFAALTGAERDSILANPLPLMEDFCRKYQCTLVLKSHVTIIHEPSAEGGQGETWIHDGMNPALGTAGSGDTLAGVIAGLLGRGLPPARAAVCGVELHGAAGRAAAAGTGFFTAEDLLPYISREGYKDAQTIW
ncbi:MAG: NAD(P)H-hydrate dehydratase [Spirochaetales bacterium]|jgi:NAD(P)H-hydrate epimerase|nr:NAD(P)H-hydrate dehydratase [Spirochaetales bacterium]